jgi:hypothetical protein
VSTATQRELVGAIGQRYIRARRAEKIKILDEFVALTGHHRKHVMRLLRGAAQPSEEGSGQGRRLYDEEVRAALVMALEASDRIRGKRLQPSLAPLTEAMERHQVSGHRLSTRSIASLAGIRD